jgi:hypothetical protein
MGPDATRLRPYRGADTGKAYLEALEALVGIPAFNAAPRPLPPLELSDTFDHLDLAWRLHTGERLVHVPRASVVARLTQPVSSRDEFDSRCNLRGTRGDRMCADGEAHPL